MWPRFWRNQFSKQYTGTVLLGLCLSFSTSAQTTPPQTPLATPSATEYPGVLQTFETLIEVDSTKFKTTRDTLLKQGKVLSDSKKVDRLELEPAFLNSIILHSDPGYLRMASMDKCRFYDAILADLLKDAEGKIKNVMVTYVTRSGQRESAILSKKDFLGNVVTQECPETAALINQFQVKTIDKTLASTIFEVPSGQDQCKVTHLAWLNNPRTPYLCQVFEYIKEAKAGSGDPKDLQQRQAVAKVLDGKLNLIQKDYIENICNNLDHEEQFCDEFLNVSFWSKIAGGQEEKLHVESICQRVMGSANLSEAQYKQCLARLKNENDLCLYGSDKESALAPHIDCDSLSYALNHSSLRSDYRDCPGNSDQLTATNFTRILLNITKGDVKPYSGPCSAISAGETFMFNERFDNDENWGLEACYFDKLKDRDICSKTFFGKYGNHPMAYPSVVASILRETRGADLNITCSMVDSTEYNPMLLNYKSGCHIIYEKNRCFLSECKHKVLFNDREIDYIKIRGRITLEYFPLSVKGEQFTLQFLLTRDFKQSARSLNNLTAINSFFKTGKKIMYGIGCAEDLLPTFFKVQGMNQCSPLPFIIDGILKDKDKFAFITRTAVDSLQAPRVVGWSNIYSAVKSYQRFHPLKLWTLYGLD